jgi:hypothetical protein
LVQSQPAFAFRSWLWEAGVQPSAHLEGELLFTAGSTYTGKLVFVILLEKSVAIDY